MISTSTAPRLLLGSTSPYRRQLLARLGLVFEAAAPRVDESMRDGEAPAELAIRLAREKALEVASRTPGAWVIGSDQVAELAGRGLGKPGSRAAAIAQLQSMSGGCVVFHTAVCVARDDDARLHALDTTRVRFRTLHDDEIARYVDLEQPLDCAGSFKSEGLGITLFEAIESTDPTALVGLPLIATAMLLRRAGFVLP